MNPNLGPNLAPHILDGDRIAVESVSPAHQSRELVQFFRPFLTLFRDRNYPRYLIGRSETRNSGKSERGLDPSSAPLNIDKSIGEWKNGQDQIQFGGR